MTTYFISGHLDLTVDEFDKHYKATIDNALSEDAKFVIGDARGADKLAQDYLSEKAGGRVTVYHMFEVPRNFIDGFIKDGGYESDNERDAAMTLASDADIAWVRPGREKSGTAKNLLRRARLLKIK